MSPREPSRDTSAQWDAIERVLARAPDGLHAVAPPARVLDTELPSALAEMYRRFDGASLFHESIVVVPSVRVTREHARWRFGEASGDDAYLDGAGRVWRLERDTGEWLEEGSALVRWLRGAIDAEAALVDDDGEYRDELFTDTGELTLAAQLTRERRRLDRDPRAPAPRWRLARALVGRGDVAAARRELERVVEHRPGFAWAWYELARLSERAGELAGALDEFCAAAEADPDYPHVALFWAQAARIAARSGDDDRHAECTRAVHERDPGFVRAQADGVRARLAAGDRSGARELCELALAVAPLDLDLLALHGRLRSETPA